MALGTKDFLSLSDERDGDRSLPLNVLLCLLRVLCSGWWTLSKMVCKPTQGPSLRHRCEAVQFSAHNSSCLPHQSVQSPRIPFLYAASPAHHSIKEDAGNHRLVKHAQEFVADIERPQSPQEVDAEET